MTARPQVPCICSADNDAAAGRSGVHDELRIETYAHDLRAQLWAELEQHNELPVAVADMTLQARAALAEELLTKLHDI